MFANFENETIELSKKEAKEAGKAGSDAFNELIKLKNAFPTYRIVVKAPKKSNKKRDHLSGLTYKFMENYIKKYSEEDSETMKEFKTLLGKDKDADQDELQMTGKASYLEVRKWFLDTFPDIEKTVKDREDKMNAILNKAS